jgi:hypothetical protein
MKVVAAAGCALGFVLAYVVFVVDPAGRRLEDAALVPPDSSGPLAEASPYLIAAGIAVVLSIAVLRRQWAHGLAAVALLAGAISGGQVLKLALLSRPGPIANSFPSGHVTACAAIVLAGLLVLPVWLRPAGVLVGAVLTSYVAASTVELGWHRLSDTIGALALCGAFAVLLADVAPSRAAAVTAALAPAAAVAAGYVVVTLTSQSDLVIVATGALTAATLLAIAWPLCPQPRPTANALVAAGYHEEPRRNPW